jgi:phage shock protein A
MGIFDRMNRVVKSNLNSLVESAEDPGKLIEQTVIDLEAELRKAKGDLVTQLGTAKRLAKKVEEAEQEVVGWENKAVLALKAGDEDLAREALRMKQSAKKTKDNIERQAGTAASEASKLESTIETVEQRVEDLKARKATLAAQVRTARETSATGSGRFGGGALGELDRLTGKIDQLEAEVEASSVLDEDPKRAEVEARFRALEKKSGGVVVEDELAALKKKLEGA